MVVCIIHVEDGLVKYRDPFLGGPVACLADISQPTFVANNAIYALQTLLDNATIPDSYAALAQHIQAE